MTIAPSKKPRFGTTVLTLARGPTHNVIPKVVQRTKILSRDRLIKLAPPTQSTKAALSRNQEKCTFFKLPTEIRSKIYALALGNLYIRIEYAPHQRRIREIEGQEYEEHIVGGLCCRTYDLPTDSVPKINDYDNRVERSCQEVAAHPRRKLTLPSRTCRQMYADTVLLHLELNVYSFKNSWVMLKWMQELKPVQKRAIRRLDLIGTNGIGATLGKQLTGLQYVWVAGRSAGRSASRSTGQWADVHSYMDSVSQRKKKNESK